ncbi:hypothetical protein KKD19_02380 [Patescibacteria group bacterium]|nr:hypothetical protein [Patescibacteria group bacterium]
MNKKILGLVIGVLIVAVAGIVYFGYQKGLFSHEGVGEEIIPGGGEESGQPETLNEPATSGGKVTDEIYIEMLAQSSNPSQKDLKTWASDIEDLYKQYDITAEDITAYGEELNQDPQRAGDIAIRYMQRATELRETGK